MERVEEKFKCPKCGEDKVDLLLVCKDDIGFQYMVCSTCGKEYEVV